MRTIALKVDVETLRGTVEGVPALVRCLARHGAGATFLFSLGPDRTGRTIVRSLCRRLFGERQACGAVSCYGWRAVTYGTLLPGPDIGQRAGAIMRAVRDAGHEVGVHAWDSAWWLAHAQHAGADATEREMRAAVDRFVEVFGDRPRVCGAAGWQMNRHAWRLTQRLGFEYGSDTRGHGPFVPVCDAELISCPQIPTTLPTMDELLLTDVGDAHSVTARLRSLTATQGSQLHVYTLRAEREGQRLLPALDALLTGWREDGYALVSLGAALGAAGEARTLPRCEVRRGTVPGRTGTVALQGREFLA